MFVVTPELQEFIDTMKECFELCKNPMNILQGLGLLACMAIIYFGLILIGA